MATPLIRARFENQDASENLATGGAGAGIVFTDDGSTYAFMDTAPDTGFPTGWGLTRNTTSDDIGIGYIDARLKERDFEFGCWIKFEDAVNSFTLLSGRSVTSGNSRGHLCSFWNNELRVIFYDGLSLNNETHTFDYVFATEGTYAISVSKVGNSLKLYVGTVLQQEITMNESLWSPSTTGHWAVGGMYWNDGIWNPTNTWRVHWIDNVYYYSGGECTVEEREKELFMYVYGEATHDTSTEILASPPHDEATEIITSTEIQSYNDPYPVANIETVTDIFADGGRELSYFYRVPVVDPLSNIKIDINFNNAVFNKTYTPTFSGGFITNHEAGCVYFGDIVVNDGDGSYTGSGDVIAMKDGFISSDRVVAP